MKFRVHIAIVATLLLILSACGENEIVITGDVVGCQRIELIENPKQDLTTECLDGSTGINIAAIKGPAIVNVWGSWCKPCKEEMPYFAEYFNTTEPGIQLIGIDVEEKRIEDGRMFVRTNGMNWPNLYDGEGVTRAYFGMGVPVTWFINEKGEVVHKKVGPISSTSEIRTLAFKYLGASQ